MTSSNLGRQERARRELGRTTVRPTIAASLVGIFLCTLVAVPVIDSMGFWRTIERTAAADQVRSGLDFVASAGGPRPLNRRARVALNWLERRLEESSLLRQGGLPLFQWSLTRFAGTGNDQAYLGRGRWLFYGADLEHLIWRGFLEPAQLERRRRSGDPWKTPRQPDPLPALERLDRDLAKRGIRLVLLPIPVKPAIHPERFMSRAAAGPGALRNPSFEEFIARLERSGIEVIDVAPVLAAGSAHRPQYLEADTHWTPAAVERVAEVLAEKLGGYLRLEEWATGRVAAYSREQMLVSGEGDIARMLRLPDWGAIYPQQVVKIQRVQVDGHAWHSDPDADLVLLGDSFTAIYSDPESGWGSGAGLAEQLSYSLRRPIDRLTGNPHWALEAAPERLEGKRLLVYEFTTRDLSHGSWPLTRLPPPTP